MLKLSAQERIALQDGELDYLPGFLSAADSQQLFHTLQRDIPWEQTHIRIAGKHVPIPRLNAWFGDPGAHYGYSGIHLTLMPWTPVLDCLRTHVSKTVGEHFNSALLNLYRNGDDSVDWHSDDEKELGKNPVIASLSLGVSRRFELKHRTSPGLRAKMQLHDGDLLVMKDVMQHHWLHRIPKERGIEGERINITFRNVQ